MSLPPFRANNFNNGEVSKYPLTDMPPNSSVLMQNVCITDKGAIGKVPGYTKENTAAESGITFKSGYEYKKTSGTTIKLVAGGGKIFTLTGATLAAIKTGLNASAVVRFSIGNNLCIMENGIDAPLKYHGTDKFLHFDNGGSVIAAGDSITGDSSGAAATVSRLIIDSGTWAGGDAKGDLQINSQTGTFTDGEDIMVAAVDCADVNGGDSELVAPQLGTPPVTAFKSIMYRGRMWKIERSDKMKASYSALNATEDYVTNLDAGYVDFAFELPEGDELLDFDIYAGLLCFFFRNHVAVISGYSPTTFTLEKLISGIGVVGTGSTQRFGNDLLFVSTAGIKSLQQIITTGSLNIFDTSEKIDPTLMGVVATATSFATAHYKTRGWIMFMVDGVIRIYQYGRKAWCRIVDTDVYGMFQASDGTVYLCGTEYIYKYGVGWNFAGTDIEMRWEPAWWRLARDGMFAFPYIIELIMEPGAVVTITIVPRYDFQPQLLDHQIQFNTDFGASLMDEAVTDIWENVFYMDSGSYDNSRLPMMGGGANMSLAITNKSSYGPIEIAEIKIYYSAGDSSGPGIVTNINPTASTSAGGSDEA